MFENHFNDGNYVKIRMARNAISESKFDCMGEMSIKMFVENCSEIFTLCCKDMLEPLENLTIVCKLAGVEALLMIAAELLLASAFKSFTISSGALNGCLSMNENKLDSKFSQHKSTFSILTCV